MTKEEVVADLLQRHGLSDACVSDILAVQTEEDLELLIDGWAASEIGAQLTARQELESALGVALGIAIKVAPIVAAVVPFL